MDVNTKQPVDYNASSLQRSQELLLLRHPPIIFFHLFAERNVEYLPKAKTNKLHVLCKKICY